MKAAAVVHPNNQFSYPTIDFQETFSCTHLIKLAHGQLVDIFQLERDRVELIQPNLQLPRSLEC
jgi:hypothetical protein